MPYDVTITRLPLRALFDLKGTATALAAWCGTALPPFPDRPNSRMEAAGRGLCWTGPDRWLLMAALAEEATLAKALRSEQAPDDLSVTLVSDTLTFFAVTGPDATEVMAVVTPLDLHPDIFPQDGAAWTEAFGIRSATRRIAAGYEIAVDRSYADWFEESLRRAST
ncbi:sarcosine oxidase subunit gamma family protein [Defluviimonas aestuarii]|uniref:sarcosine oxidase subunit gamma family protein n=1 Tax=Albidovulum aestuarii TaxID=1130726 RepID=UPI002499ED09|nr:sarcosine oxidase subunit gamma family protein [Defluviimonas aestuarii]MDI3336407.1 sarcosine oxidase subunit gamma family protein [Defluviimonas aestuarii]